MVGPLPPQSLIRGDSELFAGAAPVSSSVHDQRKILKNFSEDSKKHTTGAASPKSPEREARVLRRLQRSLL